MKYLILIIVLSVFGTSDEQVSYANKIKKIIIVYIGDSRCQFCNDSDNKRGIEMIFDDLRGKVDHVRTIGISVDEFSNIGYEFISDTFQFDEIIIGNISNNLGYKRYINDDFQGVDVIPQIIILVRIYDQLDGEEVLTGEKLLYRLVGLDEIIKFSELTKKINYSKYLN